MGKKGAFAYKSAYFPHQLTRHESGDLVRHTHVRGFGVLSSLPFLLSCSGAKGKKAFGYNLAVPLLAKCGVEIGFEARKPIIKA